MGLHNNKGELLSTKDLIIKEATRLFATFGYDSTSLDAISSASNIKKASLLYYFSNKEELRNVVLRKQFEHFAEVLPNVLKAATSGSNRFDAAFLEVIQFFTEDPYRAKLLVRESLDRPTKIKDLLEDRLFPWINLVTGYIKRGLDDGEIYPNLDPEAYVLNLINLVLGTFSSHQVMIALFNPSDQDLEESLFVPNFQN